MGEFCKSCLAAIGIVLLPTITACAYCLKWDEPICGLSALGTIFEVIGLAIILTESEIN